MNERDTIRAVARDLAPDASTSLICPYCEGGRTGETSGRVTRSHEGLSFICFRGKCDAPTVWIPNTTPMATSDQTQRQTFIPNLFREETQTVPIGVYRALLEEYLPLEEVTRQGIKWAPASMSLVYPLWAADGLLLGHQVVRMDRRITPRIRTHREIEAPLLHCPLQHNRIRGAHVLTLTEDIISAIKVSQVVPCCSVIGSYLTDGMASQLVNLGVLRGMVFFDGDAAGASGANHSWRRHQHKFPEGMVIRIPPAGKDPKDLTLKEIESYVR